MAYEASEITTATALQKTTKDLIKINTVADLVKLIEDGKKGKGITFGLGAKDGFLKKLVKPKGGFAESAVDNMAVGVSAAIAIRKYINSEKKLNVYLSGNTWPPDIADFKVKAFGFEDYNSSDLVVSEDIKKFYGISLKKKKAVTASDPTLINKAVSSAFDGPEYKDLKDELTKLRINYFIDLVIEAVEIGTGTKSKPEPIIRQADIKNFKSLKKKTTNEKTKLKEYVSHELFYAKNRDKEQFGSKSYIDTKGWATAGGDFPYLTGKDTDPKSMRYFVNRKLKEKNPKTELNINPLYDQYKQVITEPWMLSKSGKRKLVEDGATILAEHLLNIILKIKLYDQIDAKKLKKVKFDFVLITGIGDVKFFSKKPPVVHIGEARIDSLKTTLCGLTRIEKKYPGKYEVVLDKETEQTSDAAKVFFKLMKGDFHLMNIRIRYKGSFNPKPQFQAYMSKAFKTLLDDETCGN